MALELFGNLMGGDTTTGINALLTPAQRSLMNRNANLAAASALLQASGPSRQRIGLGQALGSALQAGQQGYERAQAGALQEMMLGEKLAEGKAAKKRQTDIEKIIATGITPAVAAVPAQPIFGEDIFGQQVGEGVVPAVAARPAGFDLQAIGPQLMAQGPEGRKAYNDLLAAQKALLGDTFSLAEGAKQFLRDPITGEVREVAAGAPKTPTVPSDIQGFRLAQEQGFKGNFVQYQNAIRPPSSTTINMPGEGERKAAVLANRLNFSVGQMNSAIGADPSAAMPKTSSEVARFLTRSDFLPNVLNSEKRQVVEAAQMDVLDAALTLGTGAAYTIPQLESYRKSYFPQIGDSKETIKSKQDRLMNLLKSAEVASGRAADQISAPMPKPVTTPTPSAATGVPQFDAAKEARYQEWKRRQGGQ